MKLDECVTSCSDHVQEESESRQGHGEEKAEKEERWLKVVCNAREKNYYKMKQFRHNRSTNQSPEDEHVFVNTAQSLAAQKNQNYNYS